MSHRTARVVTLQVMPRGKGWRRFRPDKASHGPQGLYWTLPKDRVEELEDMGSESEEEEGHHDSAAALVEGSVHGGKPESGDGGEGGQALVSLPGVTPVAAALLLSLSLCRQSEPLLRALDSLTHPRASASICKTRFWEAAVAYFLLTA